MVVEWVKIEVEFPGELRRSRWFQPYNINYEKLCKWCDTNVSGTGPLKFTYKENNGKAIAGDLDVKELVLAALQLKSVLKLKVERADGDEGKGMPPATSAGNVEKECRENDISEERPEGSIADVSSSAPATPQQQKQDEEIKEDEDTLSKSMADLSIKENESEIEKEEEEEKKGNERNRVSANEGEIVTPERTKDETEKKKETEKGTDKENKKGKQEERGEVEQEEPSFRAPAFVHTSRPVAPTQVVGPRNDMGRGRVPRGGLVTGMAPVGGQNELPARSSNTSNAQAPPRKKAGPQTGYCTFFNGWLPAPPPPPQSRRSDGISQGAISYAQPPAQWRFLQQEHGVSAFASAADRSPPLELYPTLTVPQPTRPDPATYHNEPSTVQDEVWVQSMGQIPNGEEDGTVPYF